MKTLIIHPQDESTDFLKPIYESVENKTLVTGGITFDELKELIKSHDRIIMMGHGSPFGLFSIGLFKETTGHIINEQMVEVLKEKDNCLYIWCNADQFVERFGLKGFYSGMFISEVSEASWYRILTNQDVVDESNNRFAELVSEHINKPTNEIYELVKEQYGLLKETNPVVSYNEERLYHRV